MHKIWANQHVQFYEAIFEPPQAKDVDGLKAININLLANLCFFHVFLLAYENLE